MQRAKNIKTSTSTSKPQNCFFCATKRIQRENYVNRNNLDSALFHLLANYYVISLGREIVKDESLTQMLTALCWIFFHFGKVVSNITGIRVLTTRSNALSGIKSSYIASILGQTTFETFKHVKNNELFVLIFHENAHNFPSRREKARSRRRKQSSTKRRARRPKNLFKLCRKNVKFSWKSFRNCSFIANEIYFLVLRITNVFYWLFKRYGSARKVNTYVHIRCWCVSWKVWNIPHRLEENGKKLENFQMHFFRNQIAVKCILPESFSTHSDDLRLHLLQANDNFVDLIIRVSSTKC